MSEAKSHINDTLRKSPQKHIANTEYQQGCFLYDLTSEYLFYVFIIDLLGGEMEDLMFHAAKSCPLSSYGLLQWLIPGSLNSSTCTFWMNKSCIHQIYHIFSALILFSEPTVLKPESSK